MKRFCVFFSLLLALIQFQPEGYFKNKKIDTCFAKEETTTYAKASAVCTLYKTSTLSEDIDNVYFVIPETYFVMIIDIVSDDCLKVQYDNYVGYVDSSTVVIATFIPIVKILEGITCDIKDTSGTQIWSKPSASSNVLTTIPAGTKKINYVAMAYGKIPSGGESNVWFYITYTPESSSTNVYEGYIYSENVTNLTEIVVNTESNPEIIYNPDDNDYSIYISSPVKTLIVTFIAIPVIILVLIILYKATKKFKEIPTNNKNQLERVTENSNARFGYEKKPYGRENLREEIQQMSNRPFVRKVNLQRERYKSHNYPVFPTYDSDDDLL